MSGKERGLTPSDSISAIFRDESGKPRVYAGVQSALVGFEAQLSEAGLGNLPDYLRQANEDRVSPTALARQIGVSKKTMFRIYDLLGIERLSPGEYMSARWNDPQYANAIAEANRAHMTARWEGPEYRQYMEGVNADPKSITAKEEAARREMTRRWTDPQWRDRMDEVAQHRWTDEAREEKSDEMKARWEDPAYRDPLLELRQGEDYRRRLGQSIKARMDSDPEYKARAIAAIRDPEAMAKARAATIERWADPEFRAKMSEAARNQLAAQRQDPRFNELVNQAVSQMMRERWQTKEFRERMQGVVKGMWEDPDHRELVSLSSQLLWLDVDRRLRMLNIPSIQGNRRDLDFYALSTWEANFGRILNLLGSDYYTREIFALHVAPEFSDLFNSDSTSLAVDFVAVDPEGQIKLYEIMAHPFEDPVGWAKLTMLMKQHPDLDITAITPEMYRELTQEFADQVESSDEFCGWETTEDNLYSNPDKYAPKQQ